MGRADLHVHTSEGDGLDSTEAVLKFAEHTPLDVVAITEHDDLVTGLRARENAIRRGVRIEVVPGVEITTLDGHLVALFVEEPVPSFRGVEETIEAVHRQGGLCFAPHPMTWLTRSLSARKLTALARGGALDAIEAANCGPAARWGVRRVRRLNSERLHLPEVGASDAHFKQAIGSAYTEFEGTTAADLRTALAAGRVRGVEAGYPRLRDVGLLRTLSLPITGLRATPKKMGWRRTAWSFVERYAP